MPRGDKPTTPALALKDGWIYEDTLPASMTKEEYDWWFKESLVLDGVRMGPPLTTKPESTTETLEPCPFCPYPTKRYFAVREVGWQHDKEIERRLVAICSQCGAQGPAFGVMSFNNAETAAQYWNRRSPASAAPVVDANEVIRQIRDKLVNGNPATLLAEIAELVVPTRQEGESRCEHGIPYSMECLSCGHSDYVAATAAPQQSRSNHFNDAALDKGMFPDHISANGTAYYSDGTVLPPNVSLVEQTVYVSEHPVTLHCNTCGLVQVKSFKCPRGDGQLVVGATPVEQKIDEATIEWALRELADGWIQNNEREGPHGFYQNARRVLETIANRTQSTPTGLSRSPR